MSKKIKKRDKKQRVVKSKNKIDQSAYSVTYDPIIDLQIKSLPESIQDELNDFSVSNREQAEKMLIRLLELKQLYPKVHVIYNYISVTYGFIDKDKQEQSIRDNYEINPNYLFARCNYAQLCLRKGEIDKIPDIFDNKFDLKALEPKRNLFHITEYAALTNVLCKYFYEIGESKQAELLYDGMKQKLPDALGTLEIQKLLEPSLLQKMKRSLLSVLVK